MSTVSHTIVPTPISGEPEWLSLWRQAAFHKSAAFPEVMMYGIGVAALSPMALPETFGVPEYRVEPSRGLEVYTWKEALAEEDLVPVIERTLTSPLLPAPSSRFAALARAHASSGLVVYVQPTLDDAGVASEETLFLETTCALPATADTVMVIAKTGSRLQLRLHTHTEGRESLFGRTLIVVTEEDARVRIVTTHEGDGFVEYTSIALVGPYATVRFLEEPNVNGKLRSTSICTLLGTEACGEIVHRLLALSEQSLDVSAEVVHAASHTTGRVVAAGAAGGNARLIYRGNIRMNEGVRATDGAQEGKFLTLSQGARIDAVPALDIASKEVHSSHRLAMSTLKPEDVFYATTRGFSDTGARALALEGFFAGTNGTQTDASLPDAFIGRIANAVEVIDHLPHAQ